MELLEELWLIIHIVLHYVCFQVTVEYRIEHGACIPLRVHTVVISVQHSEDISLEDMRKELMEKIVKVRKEGRRERKSERGRQRERLR